MREPIPTTMATVLARRLMEMWESGNTAQLEDMTTDDVAYDDVPNAERFDGRAGVRRYRVGDWLNSLCLTG